VDPTAYVVNANLSTIPAAGAEPECSTSLTEGEIMAHTRAADDFRAIRARLEDLRREPEQAPVRQRKRPAAERARSVNSDPIVISLRWLRSQIAYRGNTPR
jgi:hypothetical protein